MDCYYGEDTILSELISCHGKECDMANGHGPLQFKPINADFADNSCREADLYAEFLAPLRNNKTEFAIVREGLIVPKTYNYLHLSHDIMKKGMHPFPGYESIFDNNINNDYYMFIRSKLLSQKKFKAEFNGTVGEDEWSQFCFILNYLIKHPERDIP
jgi:hypothetical protein